MTTRPKLIIGTRGSPLALAQTHEVRDRLIAAHPQLAEPGDIAIKIFTTTGDAVQDRTLAEIGGKGLFTKELDEAMVCGEIDLAVHSMKDVATVLPDGIDLPCILEREDPRDAFMCLKATSLEDLPEGAVVGTAGLRRAAQVLNKYPHLKVVPLRGNVQTRMRKLAEGVVDATLLAMAGLNRLGLTHHAAAILDPKTMVPAIGQGAIGITCRIDDESAHHYLLALLHSETSARVRCERAFLAGLDGSCRTPIAGLAVIKGQELTFNGLVLSPDGTESLAVSRRGPVTEARALGADAAEEIRRRAPQGLLDAIVSSGQKS
jgi:hydroxymethylbilane synthase